MNPNPEQIRQRYANALITLGELLQDAQVLADRHRVSLADAGWADSAVEEAATDLLVGLQDAAIHAVFREDSEAVSVEPAGHRSGL